LTDKSQQTENRKKFDKILITTTGAQKNTQGQKVEKKRLEIIRRVEIQSSRGKEVNEFERIIMMLVCGCKDK